ncbi:hypothetical protein BCV69DRAFT_47344 [Microstroma glucosiphilum]|uniref:Uncharacterized protein n=1 Tax=Pseudomicrostroma glucosiphilum TaxID=1684307 RepID=A0A316U315_9BASI|nr:hypothetical protein BCV69DRAFT_47344 [Pseudomicrostroma glucosiphilum]PWN19194.1 hypothetical protein BCV69DRAFT_47344 [Pseudomicrostroma glucosiphilum]
MKRQTRGKADQATDVWDGSSPPPRTFDAMRCDAEQTVRQSGRAHRGWQMRPWRERESYLLCLPSPTQQAKQRGKPTPSLWKPAQSTHSCSAQISSGAPHTCSSRHRPNCQSERCRCQAPSTATAIAPFVGEYFSYMDRPACRVQMKEQCVAMIAGCASQRSDWHCM